MTKQMLGDNELSHIRLFEKKDIPLIVDCFAKFDWHKPKETFENYLYEQAESERLVWLAFYGEPLAGYVTLKWLSYYEPFQEKKIPEIMDLNVLPPYRNKGIGSLLLKTAEKMATTRSKIVGLGVGLYHDYGNAQKLYSKRGYLPDGNGITYQYKSVKPGSTVSLDDDLILWFTKTIQFPDRLNMMQNPLIETQRLILRPPKLGDEKPLNQAINRSLPELQRWMPWAKDPSMQPTIRYVKDGIASWVAEAPHDFPMVIIHKESQQIIGASGFNDRSKPEVPMFEIGYWLETAFTGQGLATEMVQALTRFAFESFKAARVQIVTQVGNEASRRVAKKCGFILEATLKNYCLDCLSGKPSDDWIFVCFSTGIDNGN